MEYYGKDYKPRWVSKTSRKRFAYPTQEEAMANFKARKLRQFTILMDKLNNIKRVMELIGEGENLRRLEAKLELHNNLTWGLNDA